MGDYGDYEDQINDYYLYDGGEYGEAEEDGEEGAAEQDGCDGSSNSGRAARSGPGVSVRDKAAAAAVDEVVLALQERIDASEAECRHLRAQVDSQRVLLQQLQASTLMSFDRLTVESDDPMPRRAVPDHPLLIATDAADAEMVRLLLDNGADASVHANAALLLACQRGSSEIAALLLDKGADVHADCDSPMVWAAMRGDLDLARLLLSRGGRVDTMRGCALRLATKHGHALMVELLLDAGCKVV